MGITWRQRLVQQPELSNINQWPLVDTKSLSKKAKRNYHRNLTIVSEVLAGKKRMCEIAKSNGVSPSHLSKLMSRCLSGPEEEPPPLSRALIPYKHLNKNHRRTELSRLSESKGGACAFSYLIQEVPGLQHHLDTMIKGSVKRFRSGQNLTITALHAAFIRYLEDKNWPRDTYPFTEISRGYESLRQYLIKKTTEYCTPKTSGRRIPASRTPLRIFSEIQIDSQMIDCNGSVALELNDQFESLRLSRVTLIQARDTATGCTLAFNIALTTHPSADDILTLFEKMTQEWQPIQLKTKGLSYNPGACLPSTLHPNFRRPAFGIIRMDNAFAHIAHSVRQIVCHQLHATLNFGIPAQPKSRNVIEQAFSLLNYPIHRFPSTTGSHPQDEKKVSAVKSTHLP